MALPVTRYARSGEVHIAWQSLGVGPVDVIFVPGWVSHVEASWRFPEVASFLRTLAQGCRLLVFDKRGTGLSDPMPRASTMEERMDDVRAVLDAASVRRAVVFGASEGVSLAILFAATYPERTLGLVAYGGFTCRRRTPDYPWAPSDAATREADGAGAALVGRPDGARHADAVAREGWPLRHALRLIPAPEREPWRRRGAAPLQHRRRLPGRARARGCAGACAAPHRRPRREDRRRPFHRPPHRRRAVRGAARRRSLAICG